MLPNINKLFFKDTSFASLMRQRVYDVLLVASKYQVFTIEEDGRIDEQIFNEYTALNLRYPPRVTHAYDETEADQLMRERKFDLIIFMPGGQNEDPFSWPRHIKQQNPTLPLVVLTPYNRTLMERYAHEDLSHIDYVYSWLGNSELLLAIIKLVEDRMNVDDDIKAVGLQTILFVEDNVRFYSAILPMLYKHVFTQSRSFMTEALNPHEQMLRMRGRPKILLARNYEEAAQLYLKYKDNMLGVITDVEFPSQHTQDKEAGLHLCELIRQHDPYIPIIVESTETVNALAAGQYGAAFIDKSSNTLLMDLRRLITSKFGFGEFLFQNPRTGEQEAVVRNLRDLQDQIFNISDETLYWYVSHNDVSRWLYSRALLPLAEFLGAIQVDGYEETDMKRVKQIIFDAILSYRKIKNRGVVAQFHREQFDQYSNFARIGGGSMGSKGRGLAFIDAMIKRNYTLEDIEHATVTIPKTVVLCTDIFTQFMEENELYPTALSDAPDEVILSAFLHARLPHQVIGDLRVLIDAVSGPIAIRSSSMLEDTQYQPFAGIYSTYMIPYDTRSKSHTLLMLTEAVKAVYASVFYNRAKAYMSATKNVIDEERMAVVIQEVVGQERGTHFYPSFSGVTRSINYYPIGQERAEEGIAQVALGLGKHIVDGGQTLRFSPAHPQQVLQVSTPEYALRLTQTTFNALDLNNIQFQPQVDDGFNLLTLDLKAAEADGALTYIASTYDFRQQLMTDNISEPGRRVLTFANILKHDVFPLPRILSELLAISTDEMAAPVEIEFAVNLDYSSKRQHTFYVLQIRPIVDPKSEQLAQVDTSNTEHALITSDNALGHGVVDNIQDIIFVRPEAFDASKTELMREQVAQLNAQLVALRRPYLLIGPGRWGSSDPWLGIPVKWPDISGARIIVESGLDRYRIEPSQGTHFFQNLTSFGVAYLTVNPYCKQGSVDYDRLNGFAVEHETPYIRHVRTDHPIIAHIDGRSGRAVISMQP
ncbi:MAG: phosphoenolpyruvate synthase [Paludibacteraceae bacterium]|nr:phosphoenolpyruvate synthase [Paludibacteraceae bacterium]